MMLLLFDIITPLLMAIDRYRYKTVFTPFICLSFTYFVLVNLNNLLFVNIYNYFAVTDYAIGIVLIFFLVLSAISNVFALFLKRSSKVALQESGKSDTKMCFLNKTQTKFVIILFALGLAAYLLSLIINIRAYGISNIKRSNNGILAHISFLCQICAPIMLFSAKFKHKFVAYFCVALSFIIAIIYAQKYVIFTNIIYTLLYFILDRKTHGKKIIKYLIVFVCFALLVFLLVYGFLPYFTSGKPQDSLEENLSFAFKNFCMYLLSPIVANNYTMTHNLHEGVAITFCVPINIIRAFSGNHNYVSPVYEFLFQYASGNSFTNVSGILGELTYCLGIMGAILYMGIVFSIIYVFYVRFRNTRRYRMTVSFLMAILVFSFFCNFFTVSGMMFQLIYTFIIETIILLLRTRKKPSIRVEILAQKHQLRTPQNRSAIQ